jgi:AcrR family transcriptional regulator
MRELPAVMVAKVMKAADLLAQQGLDGTKMDDIASVTGVPKATLYYYFAGKEDVLAFLFRQLLGEVGDAVRAAVDAPGTAAERLRALLRAHLAIFASRYEASRALQFDLGRAARIPDIQAATDAAFVDPVTALLTEGSADGSLRAVTDPRATALAILGAVTSTGLNAFGRRGGRSRSPKVDRTAEMLSSLVLDGLRP